MTRALLLATVLFLAAAPVPMVPLEPIGAILDAFKQYPVVALGEGPHGNILGHEFRLKLIRDPRFAQTVNDIVVEFGAGQHQDLLDRYILKGENIPRAQLLHVWRDTTAATSASDRPMYEDFYRAVHDLNRTLPAERRIRVIAGDAPIDWSKVTNRLNFLPYALQKGPHIAEVVQKEVLAKHRKALMIFGDGNYQGRDVNDPKVMINKIAGPPDHRQVFIINTLYGSDEVLAQPGINTWKAPKLAMIRGTAFGAKPYARIYSPPPVPGWEGVTMQQSFDAMLYLGPQSDMKQEPFPVELCADKDYMAMRTRRLGFEPPQVRKQYIDAFVKGCEAIVRQRKQTGPA